MRRLWLLVALVVLCSSMAWGQDPTPQVVVLPNIIGLNIPQAAAALNHVGLRLGDEITQLIPIGANAISAQSISPGQSVTLGTIINVTVQRAPNALLIYDDNDITLVNDTGAPINLWTLTFMALDGAQASFVARRWNNALSVGGCAQLWSVTRTEPKLLTECEGTPRWLTTNDAAEHFWTPDSGTTQFAIVQDGIQRGVCPMSIDGRCEFYLAGDEITAYAYFVYSQNEFVVYNRSQSAWMPLAGLEIATSGGDTLAIAVPETFGNPDTVALIDRPAPGQCLRLLAAPVEVNAQPCDVIAEATVDDAFWRAPFSITSLTDGTTRTCPAAVEGRTAFCLIPR